VHIRGSFRPLKRPEKTLNLHFRLIPGTDTIYNNQNSKIKISKWEMGRI
jgi:hypothetical protein